MAETVKRSGGQALVDQLLIHGADCAYCVPGESYLEVLDALYDVRDRFTLYNARHEAGAADMAEAYGKLTGRPGICMVTRGPGACQAAVGVHIAYQDSTPMILLVGQVGRETMDRESFQEIDYRQMFAPVAKWAAQIDSAARIPEYMARAFRVATSGRPGPVVLALPEDMLTDVVEVADAMPYTPSVPALSPGDAAAVMAALSKAERPLLLAGGPGWSDAGCAALLRFATDNRLPVATSFRRQDLIDNRSDVYVGDFGTGVAPSLVKRLAEADLLLVIGARLGEITTKTYSTLSVPTPAQTLVHIHVDANEIGRVYSPAVSAVSGPDAALSALTAQPAAAAPEDWCARLRAEYLSDSEPPPHDYPLDMGQAMADMRDLIPANAVVTLDAGNHTGWAQRFLRYGRPGRQIGSTCGSMGYAVPAAVAASLADPKRQAIAFVGDGGFMMSGMEIATAVQHGGRPIVLVFNNGTYGTIRMHQEREHPARVSGTDIAASDIGMISRGLGAAHERITETAEFRPALLRAFEHDGPTVIELMTDPEQISTRTTVSRLRGQQARTNS
ncbi:thiamine pyrophosphate-dependent enzyme [Martelella mediterranea]|uniref:Acetolactate synthase isozyme 2 large subunit n=1 Tax=Martelella mediterranea DSM 17316 TaxID=1122214 RepID=A0A1U9ZA22_9HYPH|nr:thiamine pyrophosphate-dependent enzyme [Martelella mediterranea]AQZ54547.1 Acetolactate synthase isozyme 2 large subunit [Martelella mediterranea DSM 17316]